jgi:hypothetical protein
LLLGPPTSLFYIDNEDLQSHEVTVEVFDSHNESIFKETYELAPEARISQPKPVWLILQWSMPWSKGKYIYWSKGAYKFKIILDGETEGSLGALLHPWVSVDININSNSSSLVKIQMDTV